MKRTLYWVTKDLRVEDNQALHLASNSDALLCVSVVDKRWFEATNFQCKPLGDIRWHFLQGCLSDFNQSLLKLGQRLHIVYGDTLSSLEKLCQQYDITNIVTTRLPGTYENKLVEQLQSRLSTSLPNQVAPIEQVEQFTLFNQAQLPFDVEDLPASYSKFRKVVQNIETAPLAPSIELLPAPFKNMPKPTVFRPDWLPSTPYKEVKHGYYFDGGEQQGTDHVLNYFSSAAPLQYKEVRNNLTGWQNSSKFSVWLSYGCISAKQIVHHIKSFEALNRQNSSTEWLYVELLWREYFQWLHFKVGAKTYQFKGLAEKAPLTSFYAERFNKWCMGNTPYALVNACMNELRLTGYLSNRGRQIVASCLVNELSVDWRYGAAWFEQCLIDYDAAVNWGNWQYIAGVGVDPRGGRHFNIEKQTAQYDEDGSYRATWVNSLAESPTTLDSVDASDWPIAAKGLDAGQSINASLGSTSVKNLSANKPSANGSSNSDD